MAARFAAIENELVNHRRASVGGRDSLIIPRRCLASALIVAIAYAFPADCDYPMGQR
jgi:hypothetical protein